MTNYVFAHEVLYTLSKQSIFLLLLQYFYGQYCYETRTRLASFDAEFKEDIDKQRKKLKKVNSVSVTNHSLMLSCIALLSWLVIRQLLNHYLGECTTL